LESQYKAVLRQIGHEVLISHGDSTSRVLPVESDSGLFTVSFESPFGFDPGELSFIIYQAMDASQLSPDYLVEVLECETQQVVYSYAYRNTAAESEIPCNGRMQPEGCYQLVFQTLESNPDVVIGIDTASVASSALPMLEKPAQPSETNYWSYLLLAGPIAIALAWLVLRYTPKSKRSENQTPSTLLEFGQFQLDPVRMKLFVQDNSIDLTSKEADLLALLVKHRNEPLTRETLLNQVWGDEGDYIGRTLDVYISKLRKKLEADEQIKLVNIRGVGYKLIIG